MKKIIFLLSFVIILSGCDAKYELTYENNVFDEALIVNNYEVQDDSLFLIEHYKNDDIYSDVNDKVLTTKEIIEENKNRYNLSFHSIYDTASYDTSLALSSCFEYYEYEEDDDIIYISLYGNYVCDDFNKLQVVFNTDRKISYSNAHKNFFGKLIWNFKIDDRIDIELEIFKNEKKTISFLTVFNILLSVLFLILLIFLICKFIIKYKSNRRL